MDQDKALPPNQNDGLELDAIIAVLLGWSEFHYETHWHEHPDSGSYQETRLEGRRPGGKWNDIPVPKFSTSVDAALMLCEGLHVEIQRYQDGSAFVIITDSPSSEASAMELGLDGEGADNLALAICRAWLARQERKKAGQ